MDNDQVDVRVAITVTFDLSVHGIARGDVENAIRRLEDAVIEAPLESLIDDHFEGDLASGTRWTPADADMENVGIRTHARSGSFYPWKRRAA